MARCKLWIDEHCQGGRDPKGCESCRAKCVPCDGCGAPVWNGDVVMPGDTEESGFPYPDQSRCDSDRAPHGSPLHLVAFCGEGT